MKLSEVLSQFIEGYLFAELATMTAAGPKEGADGHLGYPMLMSCAGGIEMLGMRDEADQKHAQREQIAFEVSLLGKALNPAGYNHAKRRSDCNDYWLCAYPAAGYTIVTREKRLPDALKQGKCVDPRMVSLEEGIAIAEGWLARRR